MHERRGSVVGRERTRNSEIEGLFKKLDLETTEKRERLRSLATLDHVGQLVDKTDRDVEELQNYDTTTSYYA